LYSKDFILIFVSEDVDLLGKPAPKGTSQRGNSKIGVFELPPNFVDTP
jgi:hypothetical protein